MDREQEASDRLAAWVRQDAPGRCGVAAAPVAPGAAFDAAEAAVVARAVGRRRDEFHTGRRLARAALWQLGIPPVAIGADADRVPLWPAGVLGSISHAGPVCVAVVAPAAGLGGLGLDLEPVKPLRPGVARLVCRPDEDPADSDGLALRRFVAKEAFYKAYFPATRTFLDFQDVRVSFDAAAEAFNCTLMEAGKPGLQGRRSFAGRCAVVAGHLVATVWIADRAR